MKKIIICISVFCMLTTFGAAQERSINSVNPVKSDISIKFGATSGTKFDFSGFSDVVAGPNDKLSAELSLGSFNADIIGRFYISDQIAKRFGLGLSTIDYNIKAKTTYPSTETDITEIGLKQTKINLTPAIERHFKANRIGLFTGVGLPISIIGKTNAYTKTVNTFVNPNSTDISEGTYKISGGFGIGVQSFAGFNFLISDKFSAGTEISYGLGYMNAGGKTTITTTENGTTTTSPGNKLKMKGFKSSGLNGGFVLTMGF